MKKYYQTTKVSAESGGCNDNRPVWRKRFARISLYLMLSVILVPVACGDDYDDDGREAAANFCNCFKTKSLKTCEEELKSNYRQSVYTHQDFIDAFNNAQSCGAKLTLIKSTSGIMMITK
jgi:hypothetical protein